MPEKTLIFKSLKYNDILEPEFNSFEVNGRNTLDFKMLQSGGMVVVYAPNGTGKTTLANLLGCEKTTKILISRFLLRGERFAQKIRNSILLGIKAQEISYAEILLIDLYLFFSV